MTNDWRNVEDTVCEYKVSLEETKPKSWLKTISAFANGIGGSIYFGIDDQKNVIGISNPETLISKISELIKRYIEPSLNPTITQINENKKIIIKVEVLPQMNTPFYCTIIKSEAYIRLGNQTIIAQSHILNELILRGNGLNFDQASSQVRFNDVSFTLFEASYLQVNGTPIDKSSDYISFLLKDENNILTNVGLLLADQCNIFQSRVFCTRWNGITKASGIIDALDDKEYVGNIIHLVNNAKNFIKNNSKVRWYKTGNGRVDLPDYPETAIHEAVVNAIVHRDYHFKGSEVHIDIFDNRLEIYSPGGMINSKNIQDLNINEVPSKRRNPLLCDIMQRLHFMERRGSGLHKILDACKEPPIFFSDSSSFLVVFVNTNFKNEFKKSDKKQAIKTSDKKQAIKTSDKKQAITNYLEIHDYATSIEIAQLLAISTTRARAILLEMVNENSITTDGANKNRVYKLKG